MNWQYFKYVLKHRWLVFLAAIELGIPWRGFIHDLSKYSLAEWGPYMQWFYGPYGTNFDPKNSTLGGHLKDKNHIAFGKAWLHHIHCNAHHWEHWIIPGKEECPAHGIPIYCREMVADWNAMSRARGKSDCMAWYESQRDIIKLHPTSRQLIESFIYVPKG